VDFVAFLEKKLGKIGTVLAGDAGDEGFFHLSRFLSGQPIFN
jgi:hypothetical protein